MSTESTPRSSVSFKIVSAGALGCNQSPRPLCTVACEQRGSLNLLKWPRKVEEDRIHQAGGANHFDQHRGVTEQCGILTRRTSEKAYHPEHNSIRLIVRMARRGLASLLGLSAPGNPGPSRKKCYHRSARFCTSGVAALGYPSCAAFANTQWAGAVCPPPPSGWGLFLRADCKTW